MSQKPDDLEAVRNICIALEPFDETEKEKIIKWACERLGMKNSIPPPAQLVQPVSPNLQVQPIGQSGTKDIKTFLIEKNPKSANQLVAAVAYFYKFEAPASEKKQAINKDDVVDACRKAGIKRPKFPNQIIVNASAFGLLDNVGTGTYEINAVGENLVAVSMPNTGSSKTKHKKAKKTATRKK